MERVTWVNGEVCDRVSSDDRGLQFGDGVFETMLCVDGTPITFDRHWDRLQRGCAALSIDCPVTERQVLVLATARCTVARAVLKLMVTRGSSDRGYKVKAGAPATWVLSLSVAPKLASEAHESGVSLSICTARVSYESPRLRGLKHLNRLPQVLARAEVPDTCHDGLMLDCDGFVAEGTASNLFLMLNDILVTPDLLRGGVQGTARAKVIDHANRIGRPVLEMAVPLDLLQCADEVFVTNAVHGIVPVSQIGAKTYGVGPVTRDLTHAVFPSHVPAVTPPSVLHREVCA